MRVEFDSAESSLESSHSLLDMVKRHIHQQTCLSAGVYDLAAYAEHSLFQCFAMAKSSERTAALVESTRNAIQAEDEGDCEASCNVVQRASCCCESAAAEVGPRRIRPRRRAQHTRYHTRSPSLEARRCVSVELAGTDNPRLVLALDNQYAAVSALPPDVLQAQREPSASAAACAVGVGAVGQQVDAAEVCLAALRHVVADSVPAVEGSPAWVQPETRKAEVQGSDRTLHSTGLLEDALDGQAWLPKMRCRLHAPATAQRVSTANAGS